MPPPKLRDFEVRAIRELYAKYLQERSTTPHDTSKHRTTLIDIGKLYGVSWHTVRRVGERFAYVGVSDEAEPLEGVLPEQIQPRTEAKRAERARKRGPVRTAPRLRNTRGQFIPDQ